MNKSFLILLTITFFNYIKSFFDKAKYIKNSINAEVMMKEIKQSKKLALILFYSPSCPHCRNFEPEYIKLSEYFKNKVSFYALNAKINYIFIIKMKFNYMKVVLNLIFLLNIFKLNF